MERCVCVCAYFTYCTQLPDVSVGGPLVALGWSLSRGNEEGWDVEREVTYLVLEERDQARVHQGLKWVLAPLTCLVTLDESFPLPRPQFPQNAQFGYLSVFSEHGRSWVSPIFCGVEQKVSFEARLSSLEFPICHHPVKALQQILHQSKGGNIPTS